MQIPTKILQKALFRACFSAGLVSLLLSCNDPSPEAHAGSMKKTEQDSVDRLLIGLRAKEKAYQLDTLFKNMHKQKGFNGNVLIVQQGQVLYKNSFGYSNYEKKDSLKLGSAFQIASVSKTFTAAAVLLLKERGKLSLTDSVEKFIPGFPYKGITVAMLLSHRSGLPNYVYFCEGYSSRNSDFLSNDSVIRWMIEHRPEPYAPPGRKFNYCNTNYCLLASIVEKASGMPYAAFMKKNIFEPLSMTNTWVRTFPDTTTYKHRTVAYNMKWKRKTDDCFDGVQGDKGIFSTVEDMYKWDRALYSEKLLKRSTLQEAFAPRSFEKKGRRNYGYGWRMITEGDSALVVFHNGWWHGYNATFFRRPADQSAIIVLGNKYCRSVYNVYSVLQILGGNVQAEEEEEEGGEEPSK